MIKGFNVKGKKDERPWYYTKSAWGAVAFAVLILVNGAGIDLPYEVLFGLVATFTGYSVADRLR